MKLSSRLLLPLLLVVLGIMSAGGVWAIRERSRFLAAETQRETRAFAIALGLSLEQAFDESNMREVQQIINRLSQEPMIYGILVYGRDGRILFLSSSLQAARPSVPAQLRTVLAERRTVTLDRRLDGRPVYSVVSPIFGPDHAVQGAYEVAQPLSVIEAERAGIRHRVMVNTLLLLGAVTAVILLLVRTLIGRPLERLVVAVRALGRGEMNYRIEEERGAGELAELAREFNRMADHVESARNELLREAEERLVLERQLRQAEKLAAVGNLAAGLAHEIAAPLHVIRGRAEMLLKREPPAGVRDRNLRIIVEQIGRITLVVQNLLDFARRREPRAEAADVGQVIDGVAELMEGEFARGGVELAREGARSAWIRGDPHLLHQVFLNLLVNASHALESAPGERRVTVRLREEAAGDGVGEVVAEVEDTGPGIADEVLPQIFEPFFTTKTGGEGTGLGLAVARGIVEEHGGRIEAARAPGGGALFRVVLPAAREASRG